MENKNIKDHIKELERQILVADKILEQNQLTIDYRENLVTSVIDFMVMHNLKEGTYHKLVEKSILKEIPLYELEKELSENIFKNLCVTVDLEATTEHLKTNLGMTEVVVEEIIKKISKLQIATKYDLEKTVK